HPRLALPEAFPVQAARPPDKVEIGAHFHIRVEWQDLREIADELAHLICLIADAFPTHRRMAKGWVIVRRQEFHGGRFAGAIGTEQADYFTTLDVKRGFMQSHHRAVVHTEVRDSNHAWHLLSRKVC